MLKAVFHCDKIKLFLCQTDKFLNEIRTNVDK